MYTLAYSKTNVYNYIHTHQRMEYDRCLYMTYKDQKQQAQTYAITHDTNK